MNLAIRDIRHSLGRFALTTIGVGMLLMVVMGMGGIYRGIIDDATLVVDSSWAPICGSCSATRAGPLPKSHECRATSSTASSPFPA